MEICGAVYVGIIVFILNLILLFKMYQLYNALETALPLLSPTIEQYKLGARYLLIGLPIISLLITYAMCRFGYNFHKSEICENIFNQSLID